MGRRLTKDQFIERSIKVHSDKYDYSKTVYNNFNTKVSILCKHHNKYFEILPVNHIYQKAGCPLCTSERLSKMWRKTKEQFIQDSEKVHGKYYDYSKVEYFGNKVKVIIGCPKHGDFLVKPLAHMRGSKCTKCVAEKGRINYNRKEVKKEENKNKPLYFYILKFNNEDENFLKIGITKHGSKVRYYGSKSRGGYNIELIEEIVTNTLDAYKIEFFIKTYLQAYKYKPNNKFPGFTECFSIDGIESIFIIRDFIKNYDKLSNISKLVIKHHYNFNINDF